MGYDCTMFVVKKSMQFSGDTKRFAEVIAMFEMCKMDYSGAYHKLFVNESSKKTTDCYIYIGDTETTEDCYGSLLTEASIEDTIKALESDNAKEPYRRIPPVLAYLKTFDISQWTDLEGNVVVLHYGH